MYQGSKSESEKIGNSDRNRKISESERKGFVIGNSDLKSENIGNNFVIGNSDLKQHIGYFHERGKIFYKIFFISDKIAV